MNSISDILSSGANHLFKSDSTNTSNDSLYSSHLASNIQQTHPNTANNNESLNSTQIHQLKSMIYSMKDQLDGMLRLVNGQTVPSVVTETHESADLHTGERIIEGVFTGEHMVGADGKEYPVPPNYASKSKLVEGDMMKLTITGQGKFIYKQISPIERQRLIGEVMTDPLTGQWSVQSNGKLYKILTASVTFYKGKAGDEAIFLVPKDGESSWGAVENIIHK